MLPEARARIGGRIHTVPCGQNGRPLELGAQWIHGGCPANSIYNYALSRDLLGGRQPRRDEEEENKPAESLGMLAMPRGHHFTSEGRVLAAKAVSQAWNIYVDLAQQMRYFTTDGSSSADKLTDKTMEEFFWRRAYLQLENLVGSSSHRWEVELALSGMAQGLAAYISDDLFESGPYMSEELPGGDVIMPGGLAQLPASLAANLSPNSVHLSEIVTGIVWDEAGVTVTTVTTGGSIKSYQAGHTIVTLPLGVLAASPAPITPPLDAAKQRAVNNMRTGRLAKVFLEWERPWWAEGGGSLYLAWSRSEVMEASSARPDLWVRHIAFFSEVEGQPSLLLMWVAGAAAGVLDGLADSEVQTTVGQLLRQFTGDPGLELPVRWDPSSSTCTSVLV